MCGLDRLRLLESPDHAVLAQPWEFDVLHIECSPALGDQGSSSGRFVEPALGNTGFLSNVWRIRRGRPAFEQQIGPLPEVGAFVAWFVPPLIILSGVGQMAMEQPILRALGVGLSLYSQIMVLWTVRTLGRLLIPGLAVFRDHVLVTSGPFVTAIIKELPTEEAMLRAKFGAAYEA